MCSFSYITFKKKTKRITFFGFNETRVTFRMNESKKSCIINSLFPNCHYWPEILQHFSVRIQNCPTDL